MVKEVISCPTYHLRTGWVINVWLSGIPPITRMEGKRSTFWRHLNGVVVMPAPYCPIQSLWDWRRWPSTIGGDAIIQTSTLWISWNNLSGRMYPTRSLKYSVIWPESLTILFRQVKSTIELRFGKSVDLQVENWARTWSGFHLRNKIPTM